MYNAAFHLPAVGSTIWVNISFSLNTTSRYKTAGYSRSVCKRIVGRSRYRGKQPQLPSLKKNYKKLATSDLLEIKGY
jgi:hypothetical protein